MTNGFQEKTFNEILGGDHVNDPATIIPIFPSGTVRGVDGRGPYTIKDIATVILASFREHVLMVIDRDHQADLAPPGTPIKAAGWIKRLFEKDGGVWAEVEWTPSATQELKDKEYRYISPTFEHDKQGNVLRILRASLTNTPNFNMKAVASAQHNSHTPDPKEETETMNKTILAIAAALGLAAPKTEEEVLELAKAKGLELEEAQKFKVATAKALGLKEDEKSETVVSTASTIKAAVENKAGEPDPKKFVSMDTFKETASQLKTLQDEITEDRASAAVDEAVKAGKVTPAMKSWASEYAKRDLADFKKYVENAPVIAAASTALKDKPSTGKEELDDEDKAVCSALGVTHDEFKKASQQ